MADGRRVRELGRRVRDAWLRNGAEERASRPIWDGPAPGSIGTEPADVPTCSLYIAPANKRTGCAVVVLPGGGYVAHAEHEAAPIGRWLQSEGVTAMVVRYRLAPRYQYPAMLQDARQAVGLLREHCKAHGVRRVGVLGFSAGGHLAGMTALLPEGRGCSDERPDFAIMIYPVVAMAGPLAHSGCRGALLGTTEETELAWALSLQMRVDADAPPVFLVHGADDTVVDVGNSLALAEAYRRARVPCELHVFARGPHGFGLGERGMANRTWPDLCSAWLRALGT